MGNRQEDLGLLFGAMANSRMELAKCSEAEMDARENLKRAEATIINLATDPKKDLGVNEAARNATIRAKTIQEREGLEKAEKAKREAGLKYEIDCMAVDCLKWQIQNDQAVADLSAQGYVG